MEEIYLHLGGPSSALPAMVQILADFASSDGLSTTSFIYLFCTFRTLFFYNAI